MIVCGKQVYTAVCIRSRTFLLHDSDQFQEGFFLRCPGMFRLVICEAFREWYAAFSGGTSGQHRRDDDQHQEGSDSVPHCLSFHKQRMSLKHCYHCLSLFYPQIL